MNAYPFLSGRHAWLPGMLLLAISGGCSVLYDLDTKQCSTTGDCLKMGPQFNDSECRNRVCVLKAGKGGSSSQGGSSSEGGASQAGGAVDFGGAPPAGGSSPAAGTSGTINVAGTAGIGTEPATGGQPACSNAKCILEHGSESWICRNNTCVDIKSTDCPVLIPKKTAATLLEQQDVIVVGGFASMNNTSNLYDSQAIANWDLAFDEFNKATLGGLPGLSGGGQRPLVGLICSTSKATTESIQQSIDHLTHKAQVPAILSTMSANFLYQAWRFLHPNDSASATALDTTFFMSTGSADMRLANLADNGLMWHMLGDPRTLAAPLVALVKQIEPYVNARRAESFAVTGQDDPNTVPLRVTLISSDEPIMVDIADILTAPENPNRPGTTLTFNGYAATDNGSNFSWKKIQSVRLHEPPDVSAAIQELSDHPPHVIVAAATAEFSTVVVPAIEYNWDSLAPGMIRPYYVMSHLLYNTAELKDNARIHSITSPPFANRVVGVNYAAAQDAHAKDLYSQYLAQLKSTYQGALTLDGTENHYDGAYYLLYSLAAAAANLSAPTGEDIYYALKTRIISEATNATPVDVGYGALSGRDTGTSTISQLFNDRVGYKMSLYGTLGPPDFDRFSGTRVSATSAWCMLKTSDVTWEYKADGLMFNLATLGFAPPSAGIADCLRDYCSVLSTEGTPTCLVQ